MKQYKLVQIIQVVYDSTQVRWMADNVLIVVPWLLVLE